MSETERSSHISLEIDQEIFVDVVQDGDTIEDATVSTEVTSFDRVGDAYILEGAIVFAGFMERSSDGAENSGYVDAFSITDDTVDAEQFHHRLPFVLRVPVKSQARGIVNVASRISDWKLDVVSAGWIRIQGDLTIVGLSSSGGYHFQCGAQEDGDLFFKEKVDTVTVEAPPAFEARSAPEQYAAEPASPDDIVAANAEADDPDFEYAAEDVRGVDAVPETGTSDGTASDTAMGEDLQRLDRMFAAQADAEVEPTKPVVSFEFEDQVSDLTAPAVTHGGAFVPSKSFTDGGFRAAFEQPAEPASAYARSAQSDAESYEPVTAEDARSSEDGDTESRAVSIRDSMWSFVDFDGPEPTCTLRYVIVEQEASLGDLAEKYGCSKSELVRANRIEPETIVYPGQSLALPL